MFKDNLYFTYNGYASRKHNIILCSVDGDDEDIFALKRSLDKKEGVGDIPIIKRIKNETVTLPLTFTKVTKSGDTLQIDDFELDELKRIWFTQKEPKPFITEDGLVLYGSFVGDMKQWFNNGYGYIKADFELVSPFAYSPILVNNLIVENELQINISNKSNCNELVFPDITFELVGDTTDIKIENLSNGTVSEFKGLTKGEQVTIYNEGVQQMVSEIDSKRNVFMKSNKEFISLIYGKNNLKITCNGRAKVSFACQVKYAL